MHLSHISPQSPIFPSKNLKCPFLMKEKGLRPTIIFTPLFCAFSRSICIFQMQEPELFLYYKDDIFISTIFLITLRIKFAFFTTATPPRLHLYYPLFPKIFLLVCQPKPYQCLLVSNAPICIMLHLFKLNHVCHLIILPA